MADDRAYASRSIYLSCIMVFRSVAIIWDDGLAEIGGPWGSRHSSVAPPTFMISDIASYLPDTILTNHSLAASYSG